jgi:iron complex transport system substrate-binding protein
MIRLPALLLLLLAVLAIGACGEGDGDGGAAAAAGVAEEGAFPVTIRSKFGSARLEQAPRRIVALDSQAADDALALGVTPIAMQKITYVRGGVHTWTKAALRGKQVPELLDTDTAIPYESIAALRPDLILAPHTFLVDEKAYERLSRIAPTVHFTEGALQDSWQRTMKRLGHALGQPERARGLVSEVERGVAKAREGTPAFEGATVNIFNAVGKEVYAINDPRDYALRFMADLGMRLAPGVAQLRGEAGRALISAERYDLLDADLLLGTSGESPEVLDELERDTLFRRLGAVQDGRYVSLPIGPATAMAFPSILSVRYATREVVPMLERAIEPST